MTEYSIFKNPRPWEIFIIQTTINAFHIWHMSLLTHHTWCFPWLAHTSYLSPCIVAWCIRHSQLQCHSSQELFPDSFLSMDPTFLQDSKMYIHNWALNILSCLYKSLFWTLCASKNHSQHIINMYVLVTMIFWETVESVINLAINIQIYQYMINKSEIRGDYIIWNNYIVYGIKQNSI